MSQKSEIKVDDDIDALLSYNMIQIKYFLKLQKVTFATTKCVNFYYYNPCQAMKSVFPAAQSYTYNFVKWHTCL